MFLPFFQVNCELYPCRRNTEFYRTPHPRSSIQSRKPEHPRDRLNMLQGEQQSLVGCSQPNPRIAPAQTSGMRVQRNSYFS